MATGLHDGTLTGAVGQMTEETEDVTKVNIPGRIFRVQTTARATTLVSQTTLEQAIGTARTPGHIKPTLRAALLTTVTIAATNVLPGIAVSRAATTTFGTYLSASVMTTSITIRIGERILTGKALHTVTSPSPLRQRG